MVMAIMIAENLRYVPESAPKQHEPEI